MIRTILLLLMLTVFTGCSNLALISSIGGVAATHNAYVKAYNSVDLLTIMHTNTSMKMEIGFQQELSQQMPLLELDGIIILNWHGPIGELLEYIQ